MRLDDISAATPAEAHRRRDWPHGWLGRLQWLRLAATPKDTVLAWRAGLVEIKRHEGITYFFQVEELN